MTCLYYIRQYYQHSGNIHKTVQCFIYHTIRYIGILGRDNTAERGIRATFLKRGASGCTVVHAPPLRLLLFQILGVYH